MNTSFDVDRSILLFKKTGEAFASMRDMLLNAAQAISAFIENVDEDTLMRFHLAQRKERHRRSYYRMMARRQGRR
jgi:hypothetical protein